MLFFLLWIFFSLFCFCISRSDSFCVCLASSLCIFQFFFLFGKDPDIAVRRRSLDILCMLVNEKNVVVLVPDLINFLTVSDVEFREDLTSRICEVVLKCVFPCFFSHPANSFTSVFDSSLSSPFVLYVDYLLF